MISRKSFLQMLLATAAVLGLASCSTQPAANASGTWPGKPFKTVRAFCYDCDADETVHFFQKDGRMPKGIINGSGAVLNPKQVNELLKNINTFSPREHHTACFVPHHAFVFYGADGQPVGSLEICFTCDDYRAFPSGDLPKHFDLTKTWQILDELNVPKGSGKGFYTNLYQSCRLRR